MLQGALNHCIVKLVVDFSIQPQYTLCLESTAEELLQ